MSQVSEPDAWALFLNQIPGLSIISLWSLSCVQLFVTPMDCSTPGLPVHHQLLELAQTHVHLIGDAIQPSHPPSSPSPPAFNLSQHQGLFQGVSSSHLLSLALGKCLHLSGPQFSSVQSFSRVRLFEGTGTAWSREPRSPPSVGTTWRSQKGLAFGLKALTAPPLC